MNAHVTSHPRWMKVVSLLIAVNFFWFELSYAAPVGGQVVAGNAAISQNGATTQITQASQNTVINWQGFDTAAHEAVNFIQPNSSAIALNRITSGLPTNFAGALNANGHVWVINPAGVLFTNTARIDVGGILATTADISNSNFMSGNYHFVQAPGSFTSVINNGEIAAKGLVALVAPNVENNGIIRANLAKVILASGMEYTLDFYGDQLIQFAADNKVAEGSVKHTGAIYADGGQVLLTANAAANVVENVIDMRGIIQANTASVGKDGSIILSGGEHGVVNVSGAMKAKSVKVLGNKVGLMDGAKIDAPNGEVLVGGNYQGKGPEQNASMVYMDPNAVINAENGRVILWSDDFTGFYGAINAADGFVETSSKNNLQVAGSVIAKDWLLDPAAIDFALITAAVGGLGGAVFPSVGSIVSTSSITNSLNSGSNVVVSAASSVSSPGTITISSPIIKTSGAGSTLVLNAQGDIILNANIANQSASYLDVSLNAGTSGSGSISQGLDGVFSGIRALNIVSAGDVNLQNAANTVDAFSVVSLGNVNFVNNKALALNAIDVNGVLTVKAAGAVVQNANVSTDNGNIEIVGTSFDNAGNFVLNAGGVGNRFLVWSQDPANDNRGNLAYDFKQYNAEYGDTVLGTGNGFLYSITPVITPVLGGNVNKIYDATNVAPLTAANFSTNSGAIDGDVVSLNIGNMSATFDDKNVGLGKLVTPVLSDVSIASAMDGAAIVYGYQASNAAASQNIGVITPFDLTITAQGVNKVYDATTAATVTLSDNRFAGDLFTVNHDPAVFADKNAGVGKAINVAGINIVGVDAANYTFNNAANAIADITPFDLTITAQGVNKVYDATTAATVTLSDNRFTGDLFTVNHDPAVFADKNAGVGKAINVTGINIVGADAENYTFNNTASATATISPALLTILSNAGQAKVYGTNDPVNAASAFSISLGTVFAGDSLIGAMGRVAGENVGNYNFTKGSLAVNDGNNGNNYVVTFNGAASPFVITPRSLSASITNQAKVYGQSDPALAGIPVNLFGLVNTTVTDINGNVTALNDVGLVTASLTSLRRVAGENVGIYNITSAAYNLSGAALGNYVVPTTLVGSPKLIINPVDLTGSLYRGKVILDGVVYTTVKDWNGNVILIDDRGDVRTTLLLLVKAAIFSNFDPLVGSAANNYAPPTLWEVLFNL